MEEKKKPVFNPLVPDDCVRAIFLNYTSKVGECQFFSNAVESNCLLDPFSHRTWNCEGRCFVNGYRCEYISASFNLRSSSEEINSIMSLIGQNGANIIGNLGWSIMTQEEVSAVSGIRKDEFSFMINVLKLLNLVSVKDEKLYLTSLGRKVHDHLIARKYLM